MGFLQFHGGVAVSFLGQDFSSQIADVVTLVASGGQLGLLPQGFHVSSVD